MSGKTAAPRIGAIPAEQYQAAVAADIRAKLAEQRLPLYQTHRHHFALDQGPGISGKAFRSMLVFMACEAVGAPPSAARATALAVEMIHNFSLVHDDIEDNDRYRRHRPTVWAQWGRARAVMSGNAMLKTADLTASEMVAAGMPAPAALEIHRRLTEVCLRMMEGQHLDIAYEGNLDISVDQYMLMADLKTGALIRASLVCGALAGMGASPDRQLCRHLDDLGTALGRLFQAQDDILGVWGGAAAGKPVGSDIRRKKNALPMVHLLSMGGAAARRRAVEIMGGGALDDSAVREVEELMRQAGTRAWCAAQCEAHWERASAAIGRLTVPEDARQRFRALASYLLERSS